MFVQSGQPQIGTKALRKNARGFLSKDCRSFRLDRWRTKGQQYTART